MNSAQRLAYNAPCLLAFETTHPRYGQRNGAWSTVLTINTGYE